MLWHGWLGVRKSIRSVKENEWRGAGVFNWCHFFVTVVHVCWLALWWQFRPCSLCLVPRLLPLIHRWLRRGRPWDTICTCELIPSSGQYASPYLSACLVVGLHSSSTHTHTHIDTWCTPEPQYWPCQLHLLFYLLVWCAVQWTCPCGPVCKTLGRHVQ